MGELVRAAMAIALIAAPAVGWCAAPGQLCRSVHGRMSMFNGTPTVRIWVIGTHRVLGVIQPTQSFSDLPANIRTVWDSRGDTEMWNTDLFGDFEVCAVTKSRVGRMQLVTLKRADKLSLRARD